MDQTSQIIGKSRPRRSRPRTSRLKEKIEKLKEEMQRLESLKVQMLATPDQQISLKQDR